MKRRKVGAGNKASHILMDSLALGHCHFDQWLKGSVNIYKYKFSNVVEKLKIIEKIDEIERTVNPYENKSQLGTFLLFVLSVYTQSPNIY